ncbi:MAG: 30S ribosomal protein S1 [Patescibacteria group bacterium]
MAELLASSSYQIKGLKRGEEREGIVTGISSKAVFVDIGAKTEGLVVNREFEAACEYIKNLKIGDKVLVSIVSPEDHLGQILLSLKRAAYTLAWKKFLEAEHTQEEVEVKVLEATPAGLLVEAFGLSGFIPQSQIGKSCQGKAKELIGKRLKVKVLETDQLQNRLVFSEKQVSEKEKIAKVKKFLGKVKIGQIFEGEITGFVPFGIFVQIKVDGEEIEGLVHISEVSWDKVVDPTELFKEGEKIKVKVIGKDKEGERLSLSLKQTVPDPWQEKVKKYPPESIISGKVSRLISYGAFVEIEEGLEGLLHISKIPPETKIDIGEKITCFVEKIEPEKRRLSLGLVLKEKPVGYK